LEGIVRNCPASAGSIDGEYEGKQVAVDVQGDMTLDLIADPD
jgi:hypothetical protein